MRQHSGRPRLAVAAALAMLLVATTASVAVGDDISESKGFRKAVTLAGIREHQAALQGFADDNDATRLASTPGHDA